MRYPKLEETLAKVLTTDYQVGRREANRIATHAAKKYVSRVHVAGSYREEFYLWNVTFKWHAFCGGVLEGEMAPSGDRFAGLTLIGALQWLDVMSRTSRSTAARQVFLEEMLLNHVEAATCMALWKQEVEAEPHTPDDTQEALLKRANAVLTENTFETVEAPRLGEAMDRLQELKAVTSRNGFYRLKKKMKYQVLED